MSEPVFDAFTRRAAEGVTRRGSLATLGGAGLAALIGGSLTAEAKKKKKKDPFAKCEPQIAECQAFVTSQGGNAASFQCCDHLGGCNFSVWVACTLAVQAAA